MKSIVFKNEQISNFALALKHLIHAGISTADALNLIMQDETDLNFKKTFEKMAQEADNGAPLSTVIRQSGSFPAYVATLIEVGEHSGRIEQTLNVISVYYEQRRKMNQMLRSSLLYPLALLLVLLAVAVVLLVWVLPIFNDVYAHLGSELTGIAGMLLNFGDLLRKGLPIILGLLGIIFLCFVLSPIRRLILSGWNRFFGDKGANRKMLSARFVSGVSMALSSGMTVNEALTLAYKLTDGEAPAFKERCKRCIDLTEEGQELSKVLTENGFISPAQSRLLDAGKRSGSSETVLEQIVMHLNEEAENSLERRAGLIEPIIVAIACLFIGTILLAVMLPLMNIMNSIG